MRTLYAGANGSAEFFMSGEFSVALDAGVYQADPDELERAGRDCLALLGMEAEFGFPGKPGSRRACGPIASFGRTCRFFPARWS